MDFKQAMRAILQSKCVRLDVWKEDTFLYLGNAPMAFMSHATQGVIWYRTISGDEIVWIPSEVEIFEKTWEIHDKAQGLEFFDRGEYDKA
jgi:hypothetical protein